MTEKEFLEKYGINGEPLWIVPMSYSADIMSRLNHLLYKPLGVFKTHITKMENHLGKGIEDGLKTCYLDTSEYKHLLYGWDDIPQGGLQENYACEASNRKFICDFIYENNPTWDKFYRIFLTEKEAQKCYASLLKKYNKNFLNYIKKLKKKLVNIEDNINYLVDQQEYIEQAFDKYRENYGEGYINSIIHAQESENTTSNIIKT